MLNLLPIGSVVLLRGGSKKVMIYGRKQLIEKTKEVWDYISCLYPEGNTGPEYTFVFNHEDIETVVFRGYSDDEEVKFLKELEKYSNRG